MEGVVVLAVLVCRTGGGVHLPAGIPLHHPQKPLSAPTRKEKADRENRCEGRATQDGEARTACEFCRPLDVRQTAQRGADTTTSVCRLWVFTSGCEAGENSSVYPGRLRRHQDDLRTYTTLPEMSRVHRCLSQSPFHLKSFFLYNRHINFLFSSSLRSTFVFF